MQPNHSVAFFDRQFQEQIRNRDLHLNPFETLALPYLSGKVLDYGCGMGNLSIAAAKRGCTVAAFDASPAAIEHLRGYADSAGLPLTASLADLRAHHINEQFDAVVSIGLLMFFDCATAWSALAKLKAATRPGGIAVINVLIAGTTYLDLFDQDEHCLFSPQATEDAFAEWDRLHVEQSEFEAPANSVKRFLTLIARKPQH